MGTGYEPLSYYPEGFADVDLALRDVQGLPSVNDRPFPRRRGCRWRSSYCWEAGRWFSEARVVWDSRVHGVGGCDAVVAVHHVLDSPWLSVLGLFFCFLFSPFFCFP